MLFTCYCTYDHMISSAPQDQFIVYSTARNQRLLTVACGGGHRAWDFVLPDNGDGRFVFIKHKEIVVCDASFLANQSILKVSQGHFTSTKSLL